MFRILCYFWVHADKVTAFLFTFPYKTGFINHAVPQAICSVFIWFKEYKSPGNISLSLHHKHVSSRIIIHIHYIPYKCAHKIATASIAYKFLLLKTKTSLKMSIYIILTTIGLLRLILIPRHFLYDFFRFVIYCYCH